MIGELAVLRLDAEVKADIADKASAFILICGRESRIGDKEN